MPLNSVFSRIKFICQFVACALVGALAVHSMSPRTATLLHQGVDACGSTLISPVFCEYTNHVIAWRVFMGTALFFAFFCVFQLGVPSSKDWRSHFQNNMLFVKTLVQWGVIVALFWASDNVVWNFASAAHVFSALFLVVQSLAIAFVVNDALAYLEDRADEVLFYNVVRAVIYALSVGTWISLSVVVFVYYGTRGVDRPDDPACVAADVAAGLNLGLGVLIFVISLIPAVQEAAPSGRLNATTALPFCAIATLLTWQAVSSFEEPCNRMPNPQAQQTAKYALSAVFLVVLVIYAFMFSFDTDEQITVADVGESLRQELTVEGGVLVTRSIDSDDDEYFVVGYSYSGFHVLMFLTTCYTASFVTGWQTPDTNADASMSFDNDNPVLSVSNLALGCQIAGALSIYVAYLMVALKPVCFDSN